MPIQWVSVQLVKWTEHSQENCPQSHTLERYRNWSMMQDRPWLREKFHQLTLDYREIFSTKDKPLGQTETVRHDIKTLRPPFNSYYRRVPAGPKDEAFWEEQRMEQLGVIRSSGSPWARRKRDETLHYCTDYHKLKQVTQKDSYLFPNVQDCFDT